MRCAHPDPPLTLHDIGHDAAATREQNATAVLDALPGTASTLGEATGLPHIAVAAAVALLLVRRQARCVGPFNYERA